MNYVVIALSLMFAAVGAEAVECLKDDSNVFVVQSETMEFSAEQELAIASLMGDDAEVQALLRAGVSPNATVSVHGKNITVMRLASRQDFPKIFRWLHEVGGELTPDCLSDAVLRGNIEIIRYIVSQNVSVDCPCDAKGRTPLMLAAEKGNVEVVNFLLQSGASVHSRDKNGSTPLHYAVYSDCGDVITLIVEAGGEINAEDADGITPVFQAALGHRERSYECLVQNGGDVSSKDGRGYSAENYMCGVLATPLETLLGMCRMPDFSEYDARAIIQEHPNVLGEFGIEGRSPLMLAAELRNKRMVKLLLELGADPNLPTPSNVHRAPRGATPLFFALWIQTENTEVIRLLVDYGADLNKCCDGEGLIPYHYANSLADFKILTKNGEMVPSITAMDLMKCFGFPCNEETVDFLLEHGLNVSSDTEAYCVWCVERGSSVEPLQLLLSHGANPNARMKDGQTALMLRGGEPEIYRALVEHGADVGAVDESGNTALHCWACRCETPMVELLLSCGADSRQLNNQGESPLDYSVRMLRDDAFSGLCALADKSYTYRHGEKERVNVRALLVEGLNEAATEFQERQRRIHSLFFTFRCMP